MDFFFRGYDYLYHVGKSNNLFQVYFFRKGIAQSALPYRRSVPTWLKVTPEEVKEHIFKLGKKGLTPSQIGKTCFFVLIETKIFTFQL